MVETERAIALLKQAVAKGFKDLDWMRRDPDLELVRHDPRFQSLSNEESRRRVSLGTLARLPRQSSVGLSKQIPIFRPVALGGVDHAEVPDYSFLHRLRKVAIRVRRARNS